MTEGFLKSDAKTAFFKAFLKFCTANQLFNQIFIILAYYTEARNEWRVHLRGLARGQHSSEKTWQRWRAVGHTEHSR